MRECWKERFQIQSGIRKIISTTFFNSIPYPFRSWCNCPVLGTVLNDYDYSTFWACMCRMSERNFWDSACKKIGIFGICLEFLLVVSTTRISLSTTRMFLCTFLLQTYRPENIVESSKAVYMASWINFILIFPSYLLIQKLKAILVFRSHEFSNKLWGSLVTLGLSLNLHYSNIVKMHVF